MTQAELPNETPSLRLARHLAYLLPRGRATLVRRLARLTGAPSQFNARIQNLTFGIDLHERVSRTLYLFRDFEADVTALLLSLLKPGDTMLDVGANFGYFSLLAAQRLGPSGRVLAFEPDPRNIARLRANLQVNGITNVTVIPKAVYDQAGTLTLNLATDDEDNLGSSSLIAAGHGRQPLEVPVVRLDDLLPAEGIEHVELVKMDIEGAEIGALEGARESLRAGRIDRILLEFHQSILGPEKLRQTLDSMHKQGFDAQILHEGKSNVPGRTIPAYPTWTSSQDNPHLLFVRRS
jgi:FkbM family methyltransferase